MRARVVKLIARRIVDVVERAGTPVSLAYIEQTVPDFASRDGVAWCWDGGDEDALLWDGMTAEGCAALRKIVAMGLVALSPARASIYLVEGRRPADPGWVPIMLAPARLATVQGHGRLFYVDIAGANDFLRLARANGDEANWKRLVSV